MADVGIGGSVAGARYKAFFFGALLVATFLPALLLPIHFEALGGKASAFLAAYGLIALLGGVHVWMTIAYYLDRSWLAHFAQRPATFFLAPAALIIVSVAAVALPPKPWDLLALYGMTFVNLWHHAKQNWGLASLAAKSEGADISALKNPVIYSWLFFVFAWTMTLPVLQGAFAPGVLNTLAAASLAAFAIFAGYSAVRGGFFRKRTPLLVAAFIAAALLYFTPLVFLQGKPYAVLIWSSAHGLQYYLMVAFSLSARGRLNKGLPVLLAAGTGSIAMLACLSWLAATTNNASVGDDLLPRAIYGLTVGVNLCHFWVDAFIWKFSRKDVRAQHGPAFAF